VPGGKGKKEVCSKKDPTFNEKDAKEEGKTKNNAEMTLFWVKGDERKAIVFEGNWQKRRRKSPALKIGEGSGRNMVHRLLVWGRGARSRP